MDSWVSLEISVLEVDSQRHSQVLIEAFGQTPILLKPLDIFFLRWVYIWGGGGGGGGGNKPEFLVPKIHIYNTQFVQPLREKPLLLASV